MPVFLSAPKSDKEAILPFKFTGGLALSTKAIGLMLAIQGIYSMIAQLVFFPLAVRTFGELRTLRSVLLIWPPLYFAVPYLILLPSSLQIPAVYVVLFSKITFQVIAFPSIAILLNNAAPSSTVLGSINGAAASTASLSRAFGPTITGLLHSKGLESGISGLAWWACGIVGVVGAVQSCWMQNVDPRGWGKAGKVETSERIPNLSRNRRTLFATADEVLEEEVRLLSSTRTSSELDSGPPTAITAKSIHNLSFSH
jgi:hypothetical protein